MQTYLPTSDISANAAVLTEVDLGQQIRSGLTIMSALSGAGDYQWHPAVEMWDGYTLLLAKCVVKMLDEWRAQGFRDTFQAIDRLSDMGYDPIILKIRDVAEPWWWGSKQFHRAQKGAMIRHNNEWYSTFFGGRGDPALPELWPKPDGGFESSKVLEGNDSWVVNGRLMFVESNKMSDDEFVWHANEYHRLLGPRRKISKRDTSVLKMLRAMHDRFHSMKFYDAHDHIR